MDNPIQFLQAFRDNSPVGTPVPVTQMLDDRSNSFQDQADAMFVRARHANPPVNRVLLLQAVGEWYIPTPTATYRKL